MSCEFPICQCKGTVFIKIWWQVLFVAVYSTAIVFIHVNIPDVRITFPMTLVPILGVATGMLLVFRTNTAYDRYWEARKLWSSMTTSIRNLTRNIWVGIKETVEDDASKVLVEKISALNLLAAFGYATRNYLREEYSYEDADLKVLLRHIPKFYNINCKCAKRTEKSLSEDMEGVGCSMWCKTCYSSKKYRFTAYEEETPTNIPIELSYLLAAYIKNANSRNLIDPSLLAAINNAMNSLVDCLTGFERVLRTPIPLAYSVHLHHATWIYLITLPSQLVEGLGWWTAFATSLAAFCLLGVLEIGWEIENPFGRDSNDLPLDDFCRVMHREIQKIMGRKIPSTDVWLLSPKNRPLAPDCFMNAVELSKLAPDDLRLLIKKDPILLRTYFVNPGFVPDDSAKGSNAGAGNKDPSEERDVESGLKKMEQALLTPDPSPSGSSKPDEAEDEPEPVDVDMSAKRVSFALPDDEEEEEVEEPKEAVKKEEEDEEEEEEEEEEEVEEVETVDEKKVKPTKRIVRQDEDEEESD